VLIRNCSTAKPYKDAFEGTNRRIMMRKKDERGRYTKDFRIDVLFSDPLIKDWLYSYESEGTRKTYFYSFRNFLFEHDISANKFYELNREEAMKLLEEILIKYRDQKKYSKAKTTYDAVRSFWVYHKLEKLEIHRQLKPRLVRIKANSDKEHIPTSEEIYKMVESAKGKNVERNRAIIMVAFQTGIRANALTNLTIGMFRPYLYPKIDAPIPLRITDEIDTKLKSYGITYYYTFLGQDGAEYLKNYTDQLIDKPDDYKLFNLHKAQILRIVKKLAGNIGINPGTIWTHLLRKSFRKVLNRSTLDEDTKEALMGHKIKGSRENYFDRHDLEEIKEKYKRLNFKDESVEIQALKLEIEKERQLRSELLQSLPILIQREVDERVKASIDVMRTRGLIQSPSESRYETTLIQENDLQSYTRLIEQGWKKEDQLNGQIILKRAIKATIPTSQFR